MKVVSKTSPLRYLIAAGQTDLLPQLFGAIDIPAAVEREMLDPHAPPTVRGWMAQPPAWLRIRHVQSAPDPELTSELDAGEAEAIQLAQELRADMLIMDERRGRQMASQKGIIVVGLLGILRESHRRGLVDNPIAIAAQLRTLGFHASRALLQRFEEQVRELERQQPKG